MGLSHLEILAEALERLGYEDITNPLSEDPFYVYEKKTPTETIRVQIEETEKF